MFQGRIFLDTLSRRGRGWLLLQQLGSDKRNKHRQTTVTRNCYVKQLLLLYYLPPVRTAVQSSFYQNLRKGGIVRKFLVEVNLRSKFLSSRRNRPLAWTYSYQLGNTLGRDSGISKTERITTNPTNRTTGKNESSIRCLNTRAAGKTRNSFEPWSYSRNFGSAVPSPKLDLQQQ